MPSASAIPDREWMQLLVDWIHLSIRASGDEDFLPRALQSLRAATHADSVTWVTNVEGNWQVEVQAGVSRPELPADLLAKAADEERPVRQGSWLAVPVSDAAASNLIVISHRSVDAIESWISLLASAISSLRRVADLRVAELRVAELRGHGDSRGVMPVPTDETEVQRRVSTGTMLGESAAIHELRRRIARIAESELTVLVHGENGTGKEIVSRLIHELSPRASGPLLAVNCAALTDSLLESELFGHERGAFTDAKEPRAGKFELARGGTLFLDEIGELSPRAQSQLLRVLEEKTVTRVGGHESIPVDARLVAATNRNLAEMVKAETFRRDLFFRLNVVSLALPPLRERGDDIRLLAEHFLEQSTQRQGRARPRLTDAAILALQSHSWPGNVRELRNLMERVAFLHDGDTIDADHLGLSGESTAASFSVAGGQSLADATREFQIAYIEHHLRAGLGSVSVTAQRLGLHRTNLYRKMKQLGMTPPA